MSAPPPPPPGDGGREEETSADPLAAAWAVVSGDPSNFAAWTALISLAEKQVGASPGLPLASRWRMSVAGGREGGGGEEEEDENSRSPRPG